MLAFRHLEGTYIMFKNSYQSGFLSILYSIGSQPLQIWDKEGPSPVAVALTSRGLSPARNRRSKHKEGARINSESNATSPSLTPHGGPPP